MKANKRVRDLHRQSKYRLISVDKDGVVRGVTTQPSFNNRVRRIPVAGASTEVK